MGWTDSRVVDAAERQVWTLQRFGLTPLRLPRRVVNRHQARIFCNSIPKAGTHLLERALCLHPELYRPLLPTIHESNVDKFGGLARLLTKLRPGGVLVGHLKVRPDRVSAVVERGARSLLLVRDPRDIVVSTAHYASSTPAHPWHDRFMQESDVEGRIRLTIEGGEGVAPFAAVLAGFADWARYGALVVRFEELVGVEGGGDPVLQAERLRSIYRHVGLSPSEERVRRIAGLLFSPHSPTFRRGTVGQWRSAFSPQLSRLFEKEAGHTLDALGYT
jgi:hypothetical protein